MIKHVFIASAVFLLLVFSPTVVSAEEDSGIPPEPRFSLRLTGSPLGYFIYAADAGDHYNFFESPLHEVTIQAEFYLHPQWGIEATLDFKGYAWENMDTSYDFVNFWGVPGFKVGVGAVQHPLDPGSDLDLMLAAGLEFGMFWEDETYAFGGLGISARVGCVWKPVRAFGVGLEGAVHYGTHFTEGTSWYPFELFEFTLGLVIGVYFES
jgi:hypothetical protein